MDTIRPEVAEIIDRLLQNGQDFNAVDIWFTCALNGAEMNGIAKALKRNNKVEKFDLTEAFHNSPPAAVNSFLRSILATILLQ